MSKNNKVKKVLTMNVVDVAQALQSVHIVGKVITADISAAYVAVGIGNIIRLVVSVNTYIAFSPTPGAGPVVSVTSPIAVMILPGEHYIVCSDECIRTSANPSRVELLEI